MKRKHAGHIGRAFQFVIAVAGFAVFAGCSQESADRAAKAVEQAPGTLERSAERSAAVLDDASITAKVKTALVVEPDLKGLQIDVDTSQNVVTLSGTVASESARERAGTIAKGIEGVKDVKNNLLVKAS